MWMLIFALACDDHGAESHTEPHAHADASAEAPKDHAGHAGSDAHGAASHDVAAEGPLTLSLNDGARWQMDASSRAVMAETHATLQSAEPSTLEEAHTLAGTLLEQQGRLIRGCTMDGASHDELHHFLEAWIPGVKALSQTGTLPEAKAQVAVLKSNLVEAERVFE